MDYRNLLAGWRYKNIWKAWQPEPCPKASVDDDRKQSNQVGHVIYVSCPNVAFGKIRKVTMAFLFGGIAVVICIGLALAGYLVPLLIGGFIGSFFGLAGLGGAVSGMIPGAIVGALIAIAIKK